MSVADKAREWLSKVSLHENYQFVFESSQGQAVLDHICERNFVTRSALPVEDRDELLIREGMRTAALNILRAVYRDHAELQRRIQDQVRRMSET